MAAYPGTLVPGQSISVNKYTVQVERYLSQGGFAHVYLVRTATPVYNTTHHVLKRIAVSNDAMLTEVKKEVDIMRLLKGHPNIVHLIDAAWHRMPNGLYEVFILMEFCPGGGIIDMMNRRLRERLTEAEILQIFVDVLEGVAYMHNSRPPLLHRDLKVENILQSSATSFKLCDFGSATTVAQRPPANTQEIRALEADLNRHTTLQYRAPEMVDPYMRRPVDEKSDVWALGVLLYKLCYYTTPFEEHGPLAILNVQYRIPPYPVYSQQMNSLIASMLREHGHQRPSVFELLNNVHRLRGTKSQFTYTIPTPQPLSPRTQNQFSLPSSSNALESTVTYRSQQQQQQPSAGVQARDKVLEAIAPMRRGRPTTETPTNMKSSSRSRTTSPHKQRATPQPDKAKNWLEEEDKAWKAATVQNDTNIPKRNALDDAWATRGGSAGNAAAPSGAGFGDDFAEKLWDEFDTKKSTVPPAASKSSTTPPSLPLRPSAYTGTPAINRRERDKDAFDGLGLSGSDNKPAPTLGEARLLRTGLAGMSSSSSRDKYSGISGDYKDYKPSRPSPSPRPTYMSQSSSSPATALSPPPSSQSQALSPPPPTLKPTSSGSSWLSRPPSSMAGVGSDGNDAAAETRFPSLEELDKTFGSSSSSSNTYQQSHPPTPSMPPLPPRRATPEVLRADYKPAYASNSFGDAGRSQPATSNAMRDISSNNRVIQPIPTPAAPSPSLENSRPSLTRRHRSSLTMKHAYSASTDEGLPLPSRTDVGSSSAHPAIPSNHKSRDWLTGDDTDSPAPSSHSRMATTPASSSSGRPVLRDSPSKRASVIDHVPLHLQEAVVVQRETMNPTPSSPTTRAQRVFPAIDLNEEPTTKDADSASSADEGPEDAGGGLKSPPKSIKTARPSKHKARQSSVHDLVDLYGGAGSISLLQKDQDLTPKKTTFSPAQPTETKAKRQSSALSAIGVGKPSSAGVLSSASPRSIKSPVTPTSPSTKSRPQSMFLFPSSKPSDPNALANSLAPPPEDPKPRVQMRRTSISDMVQRYESIGVPGSGGGKSPVSPPLAAPSKSLGASSPRVENGSGRFSSVSSSSTSTSSSSSVGYNGRLPVLDSTKGFPARVSPTPRTSTPQQQPLQEPVPIATPRARRPSYKSLDFGVASNPPSRKSTVDDQPPRSASPERPYQGVGKLIDQWQKKTAESEGPPGRGSPAKRGGLVAKRAGLVGKGA
ncbi:Protein kinase domain-containing protein [Mycena indigotica]|uniref:non-specific serine/threonine protein kinase n=1 Tax=Mycena indigotica TaxID=2126181 RepID=A0A8H6SYA7_9AGAR|nr:Protein kinase domain-containing protein [Mycena indigotica]KAF7307523.1 Protein kinase domain-containing protein [Mycena indigotica]